ncbi:MAG: hypothetical protein HY589_04655 [Candidatus Omnitrophica bacterium]|nr:hypothetical protein [Candidatus Omnitrophota bacterium]
MKKIAICAIVMFFAASPLFAAGVTDSVKPLGHLKFSIGAEDNFIFEKDIEQKDSLKFDIEDMNQVYAKLALGLTPYFNIYTKLGASDSGEIERDNVSSDKRIKIETDYGFLWGVGISGTKEIFEGWNIGLDTQFNSWSVDVDTIDVQGTKATSVSGEIVNYELQVTPVVSKKFSIAAYNWNLTPYVGVPVNFFLTKTDSQIKFIYSGSNQTESWVQKGDDNVGVLVGADLEITQNIALQVEGRFIDETAITAGGSYRF